MQPKFLPMSRLEMQRLGWDQLDVLLITGDAYVDHPSFGAAVLGRWLAHHGFRVGIVAQPRWTSTEDIARMGRPRLFAGITAGALDSMLAHYTAFRKKRSDDAYTPGGVAGARPNRACVVYANLARQAFSGLPIVLGGIEASLRRITHYDFWTDKLRRSILLDAKADLILYGMAERAILMLAKGMRDRHEGEEKTKDEGRRMKDEPEGGADGGRCPPYLGLPNAVFVGEAGALPGGDSVLLLPSHEEILAEPRKLMEATLAMERHVLQAKQVATQQVEGRTLVLTPPQLLETDELDLAYSLPFTREPHPSYRQPIPAAEMIRFSITAHRGCAAGCTFCTLASHQGRTLRSRSERSILDEAQAMTQHPKFAGSITDVGGPSANMWGGRCSADPSRCQRASCLFPAVCPSFVIDQMRIVELLRKIQKLPKVKHVRVASGIRHDLALKDREYVRALVREFVGGQLKIAPEHLSDAVLKLMRKPGARVFEEFLDLFEEECRAAGKEQFVIPYLISAFPGCTDQHMEQLAQWLAKRGWRPQQVQCFIPLPGTTAAAMYFAGIDPQGNAIPVPRSDAQRLKMHHRLFGEEGGSGGRRRQGGGESRHSQGKRQRRR